MAYSLPVGILDSGLGGLTVLQQVRRQLSGEDLIYVADSAHLPYGSKPDIYVRSRVLAIAEFLSMQEVKAIVVACNTATAAAIDTLRERLRIPVIGIEPAVKPAARATRNGKVGVLATQGTLRSERFAELMKKHGSNAEVLIRPCEGWVDLIEAGRLSGDDVEVLVSHYVTPLIARGVDCLVLGCTHYPFLKDVIQDIAGPEVEIIDPSEAVARQLITRLEEAGLPVMLEGAGDERYYSTGSAVDMMKVIPKLLGREVAVQRLPSVFSSSGSISGPDDEIAVGL